MRWAFIRLLVIAVGLLGLFWLAVPLSAQPVVTPSAPRIVDLGTLGGAGSSAGADASSVRPPPV